MKIREKLSNFFWQHNCNKTDKQIITTNLREEWSDFLIISYELKVVPKETEYYPNNSSSQLTVYNPMLILIPKLMQGRGLKGWFAKVLSKHNHTLGTSTYKLHIFLTFLSCLSMFQNLKRNLMLNFVVAEQFVHVQPINCFGAGCLILGYLYKI